MPLSLPLEGVIAIVDVQIIVSQQVSASDSYTEILETLGARVIRRWSSRVTHLVFKDGVNKRVLSKATENLQTKIVSPRWVQACQQAHSLIDETAFIVKSPLTSITHSNTKSMQPKPLHPPTPIDASKFSSSPQIASSNQHRPVQQEKNCGDENAKIPHTQFSSGVKNKHENSEHDKKSFVADSRTENNDFVPPSVRQKHQQINSAHKKQCIENIKSSRISSLKQTPLKCLLVSGAVQDHIKDTLKQLIQKLGIYRLSEHSEEPFDALIISEGNKRTMAVLTALALGKMIVETSFVFDSLEHQRWAKLIHHESTFFASKQSRLAHTNTVYGGLLANDRIFVSPGVKPDRESIQKLIILAGGCLASTPLGAGVCISDGHDTRQAEHSVPTVTTNWLFESLSLCSKQLVDLHNIETMVEDEAEHSANF